MKVRLVIIFVCVYLISLIFFLPVRYILRFVELPAGVEMNIERGSIWKGKGIVKIEFPQQPLEFELAWRTCFSKIFPFYGNCLELNTRGMVLRGTLVGIPSEDVRIRSSAGQADIQFFADILSNLNPIVKLAKPQGSVDINVKNLHYSLAEGTVLAWEGIVEMKDVLFFGVEVPDITGQLTQEPFISQQERAAPLAGQDLPTMRFRGGDKRLGIATVGQFLPDKQIKLDTELTVLDNSLRPAIQAFANRKEGNKYFWEYQGPYGITKNLLTD